MSWTTGATVNVKDGLREYVGISIDFLHFLKSQTRQGMLAENITHTAYNVWVSEEREKEYSKDRAKYWQVHVAPS